jgi:formiminotetrahydrofolate cyclodeaminase
MHTMAGTAATCDYWVVNDGLLGTGVGDLTVSTLLEQLAKDEYGPAASTAAAVTASMAAALVEMAAGRSPDWPEAKGVAAQAAARRVRLTVLAETTSLALTEAIEALERRDQIEPALRRTVELLVAIADAAGDVGELAAYAAEKVDWPVRPDAVSAALLAESAVATAAALVRANLTVLPADGPSDYVARAEDDALSAARRALEAV